MTTPTLDNVPLLTNAYHVGVRVADLEQAMREFEAFAGLTWCSVQTRQQRVWTPRDGAFTTPLRFTYSAQGPMHVELLQGELGTMWDAGAGAGLHHTGVWVDDVAAETERLTSTGWSLVAAYSAPEDGFGVFTYVESASGFVLELVDVAVQPMFERWWNGGELA
jgi:Glyoxalase/Bleomycin resistance protein/Dioxygenase superfamily